MLRAGAESQGSGGRALPPTPTPTPSSSLGVGALLALGINGIVGVGIFFTPQLVARVVPGTLGVGAYALTLLALLPVALTYARLGSRFDRDGGPYVWAQAAFGSAAGFLVGFAAYASAVLSTSAVLAGLGEYTAPLLGFGAHQRLFSVLAALSFAAIVSWGLRPSAWVWSSLTVLKLLPLLGLLGAFSLSHAEVPLHSAAPEAGAWPRAVLLIVFSMQGFEIVPVPGSHVRAPKRAIPIATIGSLVLCAGLYMALHWACVRSVSELASSAAPLVAAARVLGGPRLAELVGIGTNVSVTGIAFGMMAMTPRYLAALFDPHPESHPDPRPESHPAPRPESHPDPRPESHPEGHSKLGVSGPNAGRQRSRAALLVTLLLVVSLLSFGALSRLFVLSSVAVLFQYSVSVLALGRLALTRAHGLTPRDAWPAPLALIAIGLVARAVEPAEWWVMSGVVLVAVLLWFVRVRFRR